jgi:hypothetical protein
MSQKQNMQYSHHTKQQQIAEIYEIIKRSRTSGNAH